MRFMYVDESGDPGISSPGKTGPSPHYILIGFIIPASCWHDYLKAMVQIRKDCKAKFGFPIRRELHGSELIKPRDPETLRLISSRKKRVQLYAFVLNEVVAKMPRTRVIPIHVNKHHPKSGVITASKDVEKSAWEFLIQRFNTHLIRDCSGDLGLILADDTNERKIRGILRRMRVYNPVPSHFGGTYQALVGKVVEDPVLRNSQHSYFIQIADLICYALFRKLYRKGSYRKFNVDKLFDIVDPILVKAASNTDPQGIVHL